MGTQGLFGFKLNNIYYYIHNHYDSYLHGLGKDLVEELIDMLKNNQLNDWINKFKNIKVVDNEMKPTQEDIDKLSKYTEYSVDQEDLNFYTLCRGLQGSFKTVLDSGYLLVEKEHMNDYNPNLFHYYRIEYTYLLDFDNKTFIINDQEYPLDINELPDFKQDELDDLSDYEEFNIYDFTNLTINDDDKHIEKLLREYNEYLYILRKHEKQDSIGILSFLTSGFNKKIKHINLTKSNYDECMEFIKGMGYKDYYEYKNNLNGNNLDESKLDNSKLIQVTGNDIMKVKSNDYESYNDPILDEIINKNNLDENNLDNSKLIGITGNDIMKVKYNDPILDNSVKSFIIEDGHFITYHNNGKKSVECNYKDCILDGEYKSWYYNG